jgi:ribonuclease HII
MGLVGGIDEVGWGALAGPIVSVVAVFSERDLLLLPPGVKDSKVLSKDMIANLYLPICAVATDIGIGHAWPEEIDVIGAGKALQLSYKRALDELVHKPTLLLVDGNKGITYWKGSQLCKPKADAIFKHVSAASVVAKHFRDTIMKGYAKIHPEYGWDHNAGYGSPDHQDAIRKYGLKAVPGDYYHRKSYCKNFKENK